MLLKRQESNGEMVKIEIIDNGIIECKPCASSTKINGIVTIKNAMRLVEFVCAILIG